MKLSEQQLCFFDTFGFLTFPSLFSNDIAAITDSFEKVWVNHGSGHHGKPHDGQQRSSLVPFIDQSEHLSGLLEDPRIEGLATSLMGEDFNYYTSDGNYYAGDTQWHSDGYARSNKYLSIKIAFYLDPLTRGTGALRVIPGSHRVNDSFADGLEASRGQFERTLGVHESELPAYVLETHPGDLAVFNHNIKHAAFGGGRRRRMFTINLCQRHQEEDLHELRDWIGALSRYWIDRLYGETMVRTAGPRRMCHLEQGLANDGHLKELSRVKREEMAEPSRG